MELVGISRKTKIKNIHLLKSAGCYLEVFNMQYGTTYLLSNRSLITANLPHNPDLESIFRFLAFRTTIVSRWVVGK